MTMIISLVLIICFFTLMIGIGIHSRKHAKDVNGFILGSRSVGPWLSAFAFGTSYFSAVIFVGYAGQFGWNFGLASTWIAWAMPLSARFWRGAFLAEEQES